MLVYGRHVGQFGTSLVVPGRFPMYRARQVQPRSPVRTTVTGPASYSLFSLPRRAHGPLQTINQNRPSCLRPHEQPRGAVGDRSWVLVTSYHDAAVTEVHSLDTTSCNVIDVIRMFSLARD